MSKLPLAVAFAVFASLPGAALAQMTADVVQLNNSTRQDVDFDLVATPLNETDCFNATMDIRLRMVDSTFSRIDIWRGANCNDSTNRQGVGTNECTHIALAGQDLNINSRLEIDLAAVAFADLLEACTVGDGRHSIYFLATNTAMSNEDVTSFAFIDIELDTIAPNAPVEVQDGRGGTQINIAWMGGQDGVEASDHKEYVVYGDASSIVDGDTCTGSTVFQEGQPVPASATELSRGTGTSATLDPRGLAGSAENTAAYVVVVEVDQAGNESVASNIACIARVPTSGFCEAHGDCSNCSVSGNPGLPHGAPYGVAVLLALALGGLCRRKSRR